MNFEYNPGDEQLSMLEDGLPVEMQSDEALLNNMLQSDGTAEPTEEIVEEQVETPEQTDVTEEEEDLIDVWAKNLQNQPEQKPAVDDTTLNVMRNVTESQLMRDILAYRQRGFTDAQIMAGISKLYLANTQQQQAPQQTDEEEQTQAPQLPDIQALIQAEIDRRLNPIVNKVQQNEQLTQMKDIRSHNDTLFDNAIGNRQLTAQEEGRIIATFKTLYPGVDINRVKLYPEQVQAVVTLGLQGMKTQKTTTRQMPQQPPPVIARGTATTQNSNGQAAPPKKVDGVSREERRLRLKDFMG